MCTTYFNMLSANVSTPSLLDFSTKSTTLFVESIKATATPPCITP